MTTDFQKLLEQILSLSDDVRYVAHYQNGQLTSRAKASLEGASSSESDKYEELFVNPAILTLAHQRGELDCGGTNWVLIRYENFFQWVRRMEVGHLSVCLQPTADVFECIRAVEKLLEGI